MNGNSDPPGWYGQYFAPEAGERDERPPHPADLKELREWFRERLSTWQDCTADVSDWDSFGEGWTDRRIVRHGRETLLNLHRWLSHHGQHDAPTIPPANATAAEVETGMQEAIRWLTPEWSRPIDKQTWRGILENNGRTKVSPGTFKSWFREGGRLRGYAHPDCLTATGMTAAKMLILDLRCLSEREREHYEAVGRKVG